eukprot:233011-Pyramimonas_sp.AAC.1
MIGAKATTGENVADAIGDYGGISDESRLVHGARFRGFSMALHVAAVSAATECNEPTCSCTRS